MKETVNQILFGLSDIGRNWASYGQSVAQAALKASAVTLKTTGDFLENLSGQIAEVKLPDSRAEGEKPAE